MIFLSLITKNVNVFRETSCLEKRCLNLKKRIYLRTHERRNSLLSKSPKVMERTKNDLKPGHQGGTNKGYPWLVTN